MKPFARMTVAGLAAVSLCSYSVEAEAAKPKTLVMIGDECLVTSLTPADQQQALIGAVAAIVVPILVELAIDGISTELKKVHKQDSSGSVDFNLWQRPAQGSGLALAMPGCITTITGEFSAGESKRLDKVNTTVAVQPGADLDTLESRLAANGITATKVYHVAESQIGWSPDHTAFNLKPTYVRTLELMPGNGPKKQGLVFNVALRGPGASPWGSTYALVPIPVGEVTDGFELHLRSTDVNQQKKLAGLATGYMTIPGLSEAAYQSYVRDWSKRAIDSFMPANLQVEVVQTKKPSDAAVLLAAALDKAKSKIVEKAGAAVNADGPFNESQASLEAEIAWRKAAKALSDATALGTTDAPSLTILQLEERKAKEKYEKVK